MSDVEGTAEFVSNNTNEREFTEFMDMMAECNEKRLMAWINDNIMGIHRSVEDCDEIELEWA